MEEIAVEVVVQEPREEKVIWNNVHENFDDNSDVQKLDEFIGSQT